MFAAALKSAACFRRFTRHFVGPCPCGRDCGGGEFEEVYGPDQADRRPRSFCLLSYRSRNFLLNQDLFGVRVLNLLNALNHFLPEGKTRVRVYESKLTSRSGRLSASTTQTAKREAKEAGLLAWRKTYVNESQGLGACEYVINFRRVLEFWMHQGDPPPAAPWTPFSRSTPSRLRVVPPVAPDASLVAPAQGPEWQDRTSSEEWTEGGAKGAGLAPAASEREDEPGSERGLDQGPAEVRSVAVDSGDRDAEGVADADEPAPSVTVTTDRDADDRNGVAGEYAMAQGARGNEALAEQPGRLEPAMVWTLWMVTRASVYATDPVRVADESTLSTLARAAGQLAAQAREQLLAAGAETASCEPVVLAREALTSLFGAFLRRPGHNEFLRKLGHPLDRLLADLEQDSQPWRDEVRRRVRQLEAARAEATRVVASRELAARSPGRPAGRGTAPPRGVRPDASLLAMMLRVARVRGGLAEVVATAVRLAAQAGDEVPAEAREEGWRPTAEQLQALVPALDLAACEQLLT